MKKFGLKVIVFNAAAVLISAVAVAGVVRSLIFSPAAAPCSDRYGNSTEFPLERAGTTLTTADLQSRLGGADAGVLDNLIIGSIKDAPAPLAMTVSLPKGSATPLGSAALKGGISFPWQPRSVAGRTSACLSYSVFLPADFLFNRGGMLPGISGADASGKTQDGFSARLAWRQGDVGGVTVRSTTGEEVRSISAETDGFAFPRGRWTKVEQEVVLNTPKQADGILRVWIDGQLAVDRASIAYRASPGVTVSGVAANVFYGNDDGAGSAPKDTKIALTPFVIRWQ
jgi:hypothetical protein